MLVVRGKVLGPHGAFEGITRVPLVCHFSGQRLDGSDVDIGMFCCCVSSLLPLTVSTLLVDYLIDRSLKP